MAPMKRSRASEDGLSSDIESNESFVHQSPARKRTRVDQTQRQGPFAYNSDSAEDSDDARAQEQATQVVKQKFQEKIDNVPSDNGVIESIHCMNFMCHENWVLKLSPLINFVVGKNGSGKSAALTALTLCLGGKASSTNRAKNLKDFITTGRESATIVVKIKNQGDAAYMPDVYGDSIIVERHFTRSGTSGFKLKSVNGRVVSTKRSDLDEICDYFALQIDNPMNILSQDDARQFITTSSPQEKYKFFVRGVQLEQLDQDYAVLEETIENIELKLGVRHDDIKVLEDKKRKAKGKLDECDKHATIRDRARDLRRQAAWAQVEEQEESRDLMADELHKHEMLIADAENDAREYDERYERADQAAQEAAEAFDAAQVEINAVQESKADIKARFDRIRSATQTSQSEQRQIRQQIKNSDIRIDKARQDIEAENDRLAEIHGGSHARRRAEIEQKESVVKDLQQRIQQHPQEYRRLLDNKKGVVKELGELDEKVTRKRDEISDCEGRIENLRRDKGDTNKAYNRNLNVLLKAIERESFRQRPLGPIGHHVRLKDQKWSNALESTFGATLDSFIVTSKADQVTLQRLMQRTGCVSPIFIGDNTPLDTTPFEPDATFKTWLRVLEIDNECVRRQLVIIHGLEQTVLVEEYKEATDIISQLKPRNVKTCFYFVYDKESNTLRAKSVTTTPTGDMRDDPIKHQDRRFPRMKTDVEDQIRFHEGRLQTLRGQLLEIENRREEVRNSQQNAEKAIALYDREDKNLKVELQRAEDVVDALKSALEKESVEEGRIDALREELGAAEEQKNIAENSFQASVTDLDEKKAKLREVRDEVTAKDNEIEQLQANADMLDSERRKTADKRQSELREKNGAYERINDKKQDYNNIERDYQILVARVEEYAAVAERISSRVAVPQGETPSSLSEKLKSLERDLNRAEQDLGGSRSELAEALHIATEAFEIARNQVEDLEELAQNFKATLINRRMRWEKFRGYISARAKVQFVYLLSERGFRGRIVTSHKEKILDLLVEPDNTGGDGRGNQAKTLSGGEKSFSQICLLLSLWEAMGSPIRALDEFDVFMDAANRSISMNILIGAARRSVGRQFIFITPGQGFQNFEHPDVQFHHLAQPERGQTRLQFQTA